MPASCSTTSPFGATGGAERTSALLVVSDVPAGPDVRGAPGPSFAVGSFGAL